MEYKLGDRSIEVEKTEDGWQVDGRHYSPDISLVEPGQYHLILGSHSFRLRYLREEGQDIYLLVNGRETMLSKVDPRMALLAELGIDLEMDSAPSGVVAPMPGKVLEVMVSEGQAVEKGDSLLILEAMKMENIIKAPQDATVRSVHISAGDSVEKGAELVGF
jgi:biotin carboxyl carrier protein